MSHQAPNYFLKVRDFVASHNDTYPFIDPTKADMTGKSVLITGASKGVGRAAAIRFAMAGASKIAIAARSPLQEVEEQVKKAAAEAKRPIPLVLGLKTDVTSEDSVKAALDAVSEAFGGSLDVLINNAGYLGDWKLIGESDPVDWWYHWDVNIKGTFLMSRAFLPLLLASTIKTVINISSAGGHQSRPTASAYQTTKFAVVRFTEFLQSEYGDQGLIAIAAHPGSIKTELAHNMPEYMHAILIDTPEMAGDALVWLSKERREWLGGRFMTCNWDLQELEARKQEIVDKDLFKFRMTT